MDPDDRVVQSVRSPVGVGLTSTVGPEELSQRGRRIPTTSFCFRAFPALLVFRAHRDAQTRYTYFLLAALVERSGLAVTLSQQRYLKLFRLGRASIESK